MRTAATAGNPPTRYIQCMKAIFNEDVNRVSCGLVIQGWMDDKTDWSRHAGRCEAKSKPGVPD